MTLEERRQKSRFAVSLKGNLLTQDGHSVAIVVCNISRSGLQCIIDQSQVPLVLPNVRRENTAVPITIELNIDLADDQSQLRITCGIVYLQRITIDSCVLGCRFENFVDNSSARLIDYINKLDTSTLIKSIESTE